MMIVYNEYATLKRAYEYHINKSLCGSENTKNMHRRHAEEFMRKIETLRNSVMRSV